MLTKTLAIPALILFSMLALIGWSANEIGMFDNFRSQDAIEKAGTAMCAVLTAFDMVY